MTTEQAAAFAREFGEILSRYKLAPLGEDGLTVPEAIEFIDTTNMDDIARFSVSVDQETGIATLAPE